MGHLHQTFFDPLRTAVQAEVPDWITTWGTPTSESFFRLPTGSNNIGPNVMQFDPANVSGLGPFAVWNRLESDDHKSLDTDMLVLIQWTQGPSADDGFWMAARASGSATSENGYTFRDAQLFDEWEISRWDAGAETILASFDPGHIPGNEWWWFQFRVEGDSIKARLWKYGDPSPSRWDMEVTDSTYSAQGMTGFGSSWRDSIEVDYISVGTDGDPAQMPTTTIVPGPGISATPLRVHVNGTSLLVFTGEAHRTVEWSITVGDGFLTVISDQTDAQGQASATYTPGTVDTLITIEVEYGT